MTPHVILISGWRGVGKDTLGSVLATRLGYQRYAFADVLKAHCALKFHVPRALFDDRIRKDNVYAPCARRASPRDLCIAEAKRLRAQDDDYFANALVAQVLRDQARRIVVTDWRYPNEATCLERAFGAKQVLKIRLRWPPSNTITSKPMPIAPPGREETEEHRLDAYPFDLVLSPQAMHDLPDHLPVRFSDRVRTNAGDYFVRSK